MKDDQQAIISMEEFKEYEKLKEESESDTIKIIRAYSRLCSYSIIEYYGKDDAIKEVAKVSDELRNIIRSLKSKILELETKNEILGSSFINWIKNRNK